MVKISGVLKGSLAKKHGIKPGDCIIEINGNAVNDILDYQFYITEEKLNITFENAHGKQKTVALKKGEYDDIGLEFNTYLMDEQRSCKNKCIFCFIDQLPKGMRETLYFKDDDSRLSFLFGNYITLTNIDETEIQRIIKMHITPVNISVHTTNPELRCEMMNNRFAGEKLKYLKMLTDGGIKINCQLVLCPGINDGNELRRSIEDLSKLFPNVESIAAVPFGKTKHRNGLYPLEPYTKNQAAEVIDIINEYGDKFEKQFGDRIVYPADEFYNLANRKMPSEAYYGDMRQLENGVGMCALLESEFKAAADACSLQPSSKKITIATGVGAYNLIKNLVDYASEKWHNINCDVVAIENEFFGKDVTTTGLIVGQDLIKQLKKRSFLGTVCISDSMLRDGNDVFLDDLTPFDVEKAIGAPLKTVGCDDGEALLFAILGQD